jgi:hypothetical protein
MTSCVLGQLGRCTARREGKGQDGSRASTGGRPLRLGRAGQRRSEREGVAVGPSSAFGQVSAHSQNSI